MHPEGGGRGAVGGGVVDAALSEAGVCELKVQEAVVAKVGLRVLDRQTGEPVKGRTQSHVIMRQLATRPGQVYSLRQVSDRSRATDPIRRRRRFGVSATDHFAAASRRPTSISLRVCTAVARRRACEGWTRA
eukprot:5564776-Pyramimonas_sp.AAC.1